METNEIVTSLRNDNFAISFRYREFVITSIPLWLRKVRVMICIENLQREIVFKEVFTILLPHSVKINNLHDGLYHLQFFFESTKKKNYFVGFNTSRGFPINICNGVITSPIPVTLEHNKCFFKNLKSDIITKTVYRQPTVDYQCRLPEIRSLANRITKYKSGNYNKIFAIHDWVAENLYYDMDAYESGKHRFERYDVLSILDNRRTVCRGYSKLVVTLLRSIDIPAIDVKCFALGESTDGDWDENDNLTAEANHVITFALANNRWIILDSTWDSVNEFRNGEYIEKTEGGARHNYFDATLAFFSYTHRFIK